MKTLVLAALALLASPLAAQEATQEEFQSRLDAKLAKPFVAAGGWVSDYDLARERAVKEKKYIFAYFTRSYSG